MSRLFSALAMALASTCAVVAPAWLRASMRCYLFVSSVRLTAVRRCWAASAAPGPPVVFDVAPERAGRGEFPELVTDHRLGDEHRDVLATVVHRDGVADHVGDDRRAARPGSNDLLATGLILGIHLLEQVVIDERALFQAAWHCSSLLLSASCQCGGDGRSACRWVDGAGYGPRAYQPGSPGDARRRSCPHRHRAGDRRDSSPHREPWAA